MKNNNRERQVKKLYSPPSLTIYGAIQDLTKGGTSTANESSGAPIGKKRP